MIRTTSKLLVLASAVVLLFAAPALSEVRTGAFTLSPMVGYQAFDGDLDLDDGMVYGLAIGYNASKNWGLELDLRYAPTEADLSGGPDVDVKTVTGNVLYHFQPEQAFVPYLVAGLGALQYGIDGTGSDDEDFIANWGGGFKYAVNPDIDLRLDLRHTIDFRTDNRGSKHGDAGDVANNLAAMFGLNFQFGGTSNVPVCVSREEQPVASPVPVVAPAAVPAVPVSTELLLPSVAPVIVFDNPVSDDRDGVPEPADRCPGTPPGVRVDATGCPADTDRDSVADYLDACVDTPQGVKVDAHGCRTDAGGGDALPLKILFGTGKSEVTPFHYRELDRAAAFIRQHPQMQVLVEVPLDERGLAQSRAESLRRALIARYGVPAEQIVARSDSLGGQGVVVSVIP